MVQEFRDSASKPSGLHHVVFATINKTRQTSSRSSVRAVHAGGCCGSSSTESCSSAQTTEQTCCSTSAPQASGCCQSSDAKGKSKACSCAETTQKPKDESQNAEGGPIDAAVSQLDALRIAQQPESLRTVALPPGLRMQDCTILYVGEETRGLVNLMMENAENRVSSGFLGPACN